MAARRIAPADPATLGAREAAWRIAEGALTSAELVSACLNRILAEEERVQAWEFLDRGKAMAEAEQRDRRRRSGMPLGPLHGVPVGVKDIIDVKGMPTGNGSPIDAGRMPWEDATITRRLRAAGAVILGKTVTTEFACYHPGKTRNPHDATRTPGGSSSGSAAAVACGMVPLSIGTQTNGSVIRPASFCGTVAFKPSFGAIPRTGVLTLSPSLDQVGIFTRSLDDAALAEILMGPDGSDAGAGESPGPLTATAFAEPPVVPALAFVRTPAWGLADDGTQAAFAELVETLEGRIEEVDLPEPFSRAVGWHRTVMAAEISRNLGHYAERAPEQCSEQIRDLVAEGRGIPAPDYLAALDMARVLRSTLGAVFERYDAIVTPAAPGEAPKGLDSTGDPVFCTLWSYLGLPALNLPLLAGPDGMPLGVQLVGPFGQDARLLRTARWLARLLKEQTDTVEVTA